MSTEAEIGVTSMKHGDNYNRMIAAVKAGKIDVIIKKAVSRFARNVVDCLSAVCHLSALVTSVAVIFDPERINALDSTLEMILHLQRDPIFSSCTCKDS